MEYWFEKYVAEIWTEGKTDCQLLKKAKDILDYNFNIKFKEFDQEMGDDLLLKRCEALAINENEKPKIFIFDRDNPEIIKKY